MRRVERCGVLILSLGGGGLATQAVLVAVLVDGVVKVSVQVTEGEASAKDCDWLMVQRELAE